MPTNAVSVTPWDNSKFKGERGEQRRKTEICKNFKLGICKWEADCNYAHSESERMEARKRQASGDKQLAGGIVTSSVTKHSTAVSHGFSYCIMYICVCVCACVCACVHMCEFVVRNQKAIVGVN